jgi:hypothetical protein
MEPPFEDIKPYEEMSRKEAQKWLDWFVAEMPARIELLLRAVEATDGPAVELDFSPKSLDHLWSWATEFFGGLPMDEAEFQSYCSSLPEHAKADFSRTDLLVLSLGTKILSIDIGFYFASMLFDAVPEAEWGLGKWCKNFPAILTKKGECVPDMEVLNLARDYIHGKRPPHDRHGRSQLRARWQMRVSALS